MRQGGTCTGALTVTQACWHATLAIGPLCVCSSLTVQRPVLLPGPRAALFSQPKDLPAPGPLHALYPFLEASELTPCWLFLSVGLTPTFSNKSPHLSVF